MNNTAMPLSDPGEFQEDDKEEIEGVKTNFLDSNSESDMYRLAMCYEDMIHSLQAKHGCPPDHRCPEGLTNYQWTHLLDLVDVDYDDWDVFVTDGHVLRSLTNGGRPLNSICLDILMKLRIITEKTYTWTNEFYKAEVKANKGKPMRYWIEDD